MSKFNAGVEVDSLDFDFAKFGGPVGTIPEPSQDQVDAYMIGLEGLRDRVRREMRKQYSDEVAEDAAEGLDLQALGQTTRDATTELYGLIEDLCSGAITVAFLQSLPYRVVGAFAGWLAGELAPKGSMNATRA